jgi:hypothetical protein
LVEGTLGIGTSVHRHPSLFPSSVACPVPCRHLGESSGSEGVWPRDERGTLLLEPLGGEAMYIGIGTVLVILLILIIIGVLR